MEFVKRLFFSVILCFLFTQPAPCPIESIIRYVYLFVSLCICTKAKKEKKVGEKRIFISYRVHIIARLRNTFLIVGKYLG